MVQNQLSVQWTAGSTGDADAFTCSKVTARQFTSAGDLLAQEASILVHFHGPIASWMGHKAHANAAGYSPQAPSVEAQSSGFSKSMRSSTDHII